MGHKPLSFVKKPTKRFAENGDFSSFLWNLPKRNGHDLWNLPKRGWLEAERLRRVPF